MTADFAAEIAAGRVVVIEADGAIAGYMVAWPQADGCFIDNIAVDPARQGRGLGRRVMEHGEREARRHALAVIFHDRMIARDNRDRVHARGPDLRDAGSPETRTLSGGASK